MVSISNQQYRNLFISWFIAMPFGAHSVSFSIGTLVIDPSFVFLLAVFVVSIALIGFNWGKRELLLLLFFLLPCLYAILFFPYVKAKTEALIDIQSWLIQWVTIANFVMGFKIAGKDRFRDILKIGIRIYLGVVLCFGIFEVLTGIHFIGNYTENLWNLQVGNWTYAPVFIYDNPSIYITYLFILSILLIWLDERFRRSKGAIFALFILIFFFSFMGNVLLGMILSLAVCLAVIIMNFYEWRSFLFSYRYGILFASAMMILLIFSNDMYFGPLWKNTKHYELQNRISIKDSLGKPIVVSAQSVIDKYGEDEVYTAIENYESPTKLTDFEKRENLVLNGLFLFKKSYFFGVGPGQFQYYHKQQKVPYETGEFVQPHNYLIELISQLGLIGLCIPAFLIFACINFFKASNLSVTYRFWLIFGIILFVISANLPSRFLILNINWLLVATIAFILIEINSKAELIGDTREEEVQ